MSTNNFSSLHSEDLVELIKGGAIGVLPTDTVYGVIASAGSPESVGRLYALKQRQAKPGTLVAASIDQVVALGVPKRYITAVADYWPNPLSIVIPVGENFDYLTQGVRGLAIRIPSDAVFCDFLRATGPLLTSSANQPGQPPATDIAAAKAYFEDEVDFYVDCGYRNGLPSTVIRVVDDAIEVLRQGAVTIDENGRLG